MRKRSLSVFLIALLILCSILPSIPKASAAFENTYQNTGNQIEDLIGVAMTQIGYTEGPDNDTKYGDWLGFPNQPWCASFISWCAYHAEISPNILARTALANPSANPGFDLPYYHGSVYTPKRGDLFFKEDFSHVGIVYGVDGEDVLTIEANTNNDGSPEGYTVLARTRKISECYFGVPDYLGCDAPHTYVRMNDPGHPHPSYYLCTTCGDCYYTATPGYVPDCHYCVSCNCSAEKEGYYTVAVSEGRLPVYADESMSYILGYLDPEELLYVLAGSQSWAHISYANQMGYVPMTSLQKFVPVPTELRSDMEKYYSGEYANVLWNSVHTAKDYRIRVFCDDALLLDEYTNDKTFFSITELIPGRYRIEVQASDGSVLSDAAVCSFRVLPTYTISYICEDMQTDAAEQIKFFDQPLQLLDFVPAKEGYRFLGWSDDANAKYAKWQPGDPWSDNQNAELHPVWQDENATAVSLQIHQPATRHIFPVGVPIDTEGLLLSLTYSDSTLEYIHDGYTVQGADPYRSGVSTISVSYADLSVSYDILVLSRPILIDDPNWTLTVEDMLSYLRFHDQ